MRSIFSKIKALTAAAAVTLSAVPYVLSSAQTTASAASGYVVESLDRGISAINTGNGMFVSWRFNADDAKSAEFRLYRGDTLIYTSKEGMATSYLDKDGNASSVYKVEKLENGRVVSSDTCNMISNTNYFDIPMDVPNGGTSPDGVAYTYSPNDCSVGDVDGDGQYELFVKWDPSNSQDNSKSGYTGNVYIDCYRLTGQKLWRIDLGKNIRAGAHYTQFVVADFDNDGRAEMTCKTSDGTVDGKGKVIGDGSKDYRNSGGYILTGSEYYTLFDGATGAALDTVNYEYPRGTVSAWGDGYGNRVDRFISSAVYLDGVHPSAVSLRGYYTRMTVVAYDVVNKKLVKRWGYDTGYDASKAGYGDGNHNGMAADVDGDGKQEYFVGAVAFDDNGSVLWCNEKGHGDAIHISDFLPDRPGLEIWVCHEHEPYGVSLIDAKTGKDIFHYDGDKDTGRCACGNVWTGNPGAEFWGARPAGKVMDGTGAYINMKVPAMNFLTYWDGDLERELLDGNTISRVKDDGTIDYFFSAEGCSSNNSTKSTPCLSADIFGDWREELLLRTSDNKAVRVFTTPFETQYRIKTLMHDPQYRMQVSAQQAGYNQPPHPSFYLGSEKPIPDGIDPKVGTDVNIDTTRTYLIKNKNSGLYLTAEDGVSGANVSQSSISELNKNCCWTFEKQTGGYFLVKSGNDGLYLDLTGGKAAGGTNVELYKKSGTSAQLFKLIDKGDGSYVIATRASGDKSCIEIINAETAEKANVQQWEINGHACQSWILEPVNLSEEIKGDVIVGDVNHDGKVNVFDLLIMKRKGDNISGIERQFADTNSDGVVDTLDMKEMLGFLTKKGSFTAVEKKSAFYYAEEASFNRCFVENTNAGFKGKNYINFYNETGSFLSWNVYVPENGNYLCNFTVANGSADNRPMKIEVNGSKDYWKQDFLTTSAWTTWNTRGIVLPLNKGRNTIKMTSETAGGGPNIDTLYLEKTDEPIAEVYVPEEKPQEQTSQKTVWIAGDSTVQTYRASYAPQQGWGAFLQENIGDSAVVDNRAIAGRSSKSFYDNGRLDSILNEIKKDDLLLVQFAINDSAASNAERYAPTCGKVPGTEGSYEWYLAKYIEGAKAKGAKPVLVTTTIGLKAYNSSTKKFVNSYTNYCDAMKQLGSYYKIPVVDLNTLMVSHYNSIGYDAAYKYHMCSTSDTSTDMTHFTETGAKAVAKLVADDMKRQGII